MGGALGLRGGCWDHKPLARYPKMLIESTRDLTAMQKVELWPEVSGLEGLGFRL